MRLYSVEVLSSISPWFSLFLQRALLSSRAYGHSVHKNMYWNSQHLGKLFNSNLSIFWWSSSSVQILKIFPFAMQLTPLWQLSTGLVGRGDCPCWAYPFNNFQQVWSRGDTALAGQFSLVVHRDNWQIFFRKCLSVLSAGAVRGDNKARTSMARISLGVWL